MISLSLTGLLLCKTGYHPAIAVLLFMISGSKKEKENSFLNVCSTSISTMGLGIEEKGCMTTIFFFTGRLISRTAALLNLVSIFTVQVSCNTTEKGFST